MSDFLEQINEGSNEPEPGEFGDLEDDDDE